MRNKSSYRLLTLSVGTVLLLTAMVAWAAITGSISGVVVDPSGAVVPGVTVVAKEVSTNIHHTAVTDAKGFYAFPALDVGHYDVAVSQTGFRTFLESGVTIDANSAVRIDVKMEIGAVTDTVSVQSDVLQVETQSTQMGDVIEGKTITAVPLNGRSFIDLLALQPGVSPYTDTATSSGMGIGSISGNLGQGLQSINGGQPEGNGYMVNGADSEEGVHNGAAMIPNLDSISEFRIITNNFNAEYGNFSGGQINVVTKNGTNRVHGDAFDFLRNTDLDARNYSNSAGAKGALKQNQFGGVIGGPIKKDKLFFFADYQGTKQILGATTLIQVPSLTDRTGNLIDQGPLMIAKNKKVRGIYFANLLSNELGYAVTAGEPYYSAGCTDSATCVFPNAVIPGSATSPVATNLLKYIPLPNGTNAQGNSTYSTAAFNETLSDNKAGLRVDSNTRFGALFGYYFIDRYNSDNPYAAVNTPGFDALGDGLTQMVNFGLTTTINNSTVNDIRLVFLRDQNSQNKPKGGLGVTLQSLGFNTPWGPTGGIGSSDPALGGVPWVSLSGEGFKFGVPADTLLQYNNTIQVVDNLAKIIGTHNLQFGVDVHYDQINERNIYAQNGQFGINGGETGFDFGDLLIGAPSYLIQASSQILDSRTQYYGAFAQDSWRVRPTLTFDYGLRYEISTPYYDTQNKLETLIQGEQSRAFPGAPVGLVVPGDPGVARTLSPIKYDNFSPRIGIAYSPAVTEGWLGKLLGGAGKSSVRAGYGIFYTSIVDATGFEEVGDAPYGVFYFSPGNPLLASPYVTRQTGQVQASDFPFVFPPTNVSPSNPDTSFPWSQVLPMSGSDFFSPTNVLPYTQEFELSLQRQFGAATVASASYVGSVGRHHLTFVEANPGDAALCLLLSDQANVAPGTNTCGPGGEGNVYTEANGTVVNTTRTRFGANFGANSFMSTSANSSYNSLQLSLKHTEKYANFLIGYTWAKSIDNGSGVDDVTNGFDPAQSRGLSLFDVPQDLVISYTLQLPFDKFIGTGPMGKRVSAGWALTGITSMVSGEPIALSENDDQSLVGANWNYDVPNYADNGSKLMGDHNPRHGKSYFNPNYFAGENLGQVGNAMRRSFVGPGINNSNMALLKNTVISEGTQVQFRAEAFNVFNHAQFSNPSGNFSSGTFSYVTGSARDPRIMQLALKFLF